MEIWLVEWITRLSADASRLQLPLRPLQSGQLAGVISSHTISVSHSLVHEKSPPRNSPLIDIRYVWKEINHPWNIMFALTESYWIWLNSGTLQCRHEVNSQFYQQMSSLILKVKHSDMMILSGGLSGQVGKLWQWEKYIGVIYWVRLRRADHVEVIHCWCEPHTEMYILTVWLGSSSRWESDVGDIWWNDSKSLPLSQMFPPLNNFHTPKVFIELFSPSHSSSSIVGS